MDLCGYLMRGGCPALARVFFSPGRDSRISAAAYDQYFPCRPLRDEVFHRGGGLLSYPIAALFMGSAKGAFFYVSLFAVSCGAGCVIAFIVLNGAKVLQTELLKEK